MRETEFTQCMQAYNVIKMKMAEEEIGGLPNSFLHVAVKFVKAVSCIQNNLIIICSYKDADSVPGVSIIPTVRTQEDYSHARRPRPLRTKDYLSCSVENICPKTRVTRNSLV